MAFQFFTVPLQNGDAAANELNAFLRSQKVLAVDRRFVEGGASSFWTFCVDFFESGQNSSSFSSRGTRSKIDYKDVLAPEEFAVFAKLRQLRKEIAQAEAVPVYTVFTNEQLAKIVQTRAASKDAMSQIDGVGEARIKKYGARLLELLALEWNGPHEAGGASV